MNDQHLTIDDMALFTKLRMTAFGEAVIEIANDPACDQWTLSQKIRHALDQETTAWHSPETVEASAIRSSDVREAEEVRPGVP